MAVTLTDPADAFVLHNRASSSRPLAATADDAGAEIGFVKSRRDAISFIVAGTAALPFLPTAAYADAAAVQDSLDVENFLRKGVDLGGNMGVSSQAGKSRPQTGVVLRDGTEVRYVPGLCRGRKWSMATASFCSLFDAAVHPSRYLQYLF